MIFDDCGWREEAAGCGQKSLDDDSHPGWPLGQPLLLLEPLFPHLLKVVYN